MVKEDWVVKNWDFISKRRIVKFPCRRAALILKDEQAPTTGKFYGKESFLDYLRNYFSIRLNGSKSLFLRPFISAPMPKGVEAVYIDPKRYKLNESGEIIGLDTTYEFPIYVFTE